MNLKREFFEEIYYRDNNAHYWKSPSLGRSPRIMIITLIATLGIVAYVAFTSPQGKPTSAQYGMIGVLFIIFLLAASGYARKVAVIRNWKKSIVIYLAEIEKHEKFEILVTDQSLTYMMDDDHKVVSWSNFDSAEVTDEFILIKGVESYFLPKKTMSNGDFKFLKGFIPKKIG